MEFDAHAATKQFTATPSPRQNPIGRKTYKRLKGTTGLLEDEAAKKLAANLEQQPNVRLTTATIFESMNSKMKSFVQDFQTDESAKFVKKAYAPQRHHVTSKGSRHDNKMIRAPKVEFVEEPVREPVDEIKRVERAEKVRPTAMQADAGSVESLTSEDEEEKSSVHLRPLDQKSL